MKCDMCWGTGYVTLNGFKGDIRALKPLVHKCPKCQGIGCPNCNTIQVDGVEKGETHLWEIADGLTEMCYICPKCDGTGTVPD